MARIILCILFLLVPVGSKAGEGLRVGKAAPPFSLPDLYGRTISLDYLDGHPGAIVFWSASSPRSTALFEDLREYQQRWGREDLAIVAVNADGGAPGAGAQNPVRDYVDRLDIVFPVLLDSDQTALADFHIGALPAVVLIDAGGRVSAVLRGDTTTFREELRQNILLALYGDTSYETAPAVASSGEQGGPARDSVATRASSCSIPRARSCTRLNERDPSPSDPAVLAVRLCVCHGDADAAQVMLSGVDGEGLLGPDLRFALANMMLLKGRTAAARLAFEALRDRFPQLAWGEWGLGIVALAEADADRALLHIRAARAAGWAIPEAETAVLKFLEGYWRSNTEAPREEQFLALFEELDSVRACYKRLGRRG